MTPQTPFTPSLLCSTQDMVDEVAREEIERDRKNSFRLELEALINSHSLENGSNSPDWLLAEYLVGCLELFDTTTRHRDQQYGIVGIPCNPRIEPPEPIGL